MPRKMSTTQLIFKSAISPSSRLRFGHFFFPIWIFFCKKPKYAIRFYKCFQRIHVYDLQTCLPEKCLQHHWFLDQRYILHPDSDLADFFLTWVFFHKQSRYVIKFYIFCTRTSRSVPQTRCPEKLFATPLIFRSTISPSSRIRFDIFFFLKSGISSHRIHIYNYILQILYQVIEICAANSLPRKIVCNPTDF